MPATQELLNQGRYRIEQPLPNGNGSSVFTAYDTVSNVNVVVKEIPVKLGKVTTLSQQENNKIAFTNQARQLKELRHDNLMNVEDYFFDVGRQYLVLEAVEGRTLAAYLKENNGPVDFDRSTAWIGELISAIDFLSSRTLGFVHGKIAPENIHIDDHGRVKLMSVGISGEQENKVDTSLNGSDGEISALCFSPLEMIWDSLDGASQKVISNSYDETSVAILHQPPDGRSDVYSIGALLYRLVTGTEPVDPLERSIELLESNPDPLVAPNSANPELGKEISDLILKAVALKREDRFDSASVMNQSLKTAVQGGQVQNFETANVEAVGLKGAVADKGDDIQKILEAKKHEFEAGKTRHEELLQTKLREAEEMRLEAERRAAEAERLLREQEAAKPVIPAIDPEEDLLGIASLHRSSSVSKAPPTTKPILAEEATPKKGKTSSKVAADTPEPKPAEISPVNEVDESVLTSEIAVPSFGSSYESSDLFSEPKRGFPMAAVAVGIALLLVIAIGGWVFLGQSAKPAQVSAQPVVPQVAEQAQQPTEQVPTEAVASPVDNAFIETQAETVQPENATKAVVTAPQEKKKLSAAEPKKPKAEVPKKVTVDDLINDN